MNRVTDSRLPVTRASSPVRQRSGNRQLATRNLALAVLALLLVTQPAFGCPVCYGAPGDPMVKGTNNGMWVMLGVIGFVQIGFAAMFWSFWRRAREQRRFREKFHVIEGGPLS
jgi:hypothetical protein